MEMNIKLNKLLTEWRSNGYLLCNKDSIRSDSNARIFYLYKGKKFAGLKLLKSDSNSIESLHQLKLNTLYNSFEYTQYIQNLILDDINSGYPFSRIKLEQDTILNDTLFGHFEYQRGPYFAYGDIDENDNRLISERYLSNLLKLKKGKPFKHSSIESINSQISKLNYLEMEFPPRIQFEGSQVNIDFYLKKKAANTFDFLIGFNNTGTGPSRQVQITGQAGFDIYNSFKVGDRIYLHYENLQPSSPRLNFILDLPYIKHVPWQNTLGFDMIKNRESYINLQSYYKISETFDSYSKGSFVLHNNYSFVLNADSNFIKTNYKLPSVIDFSYLSYGLEYRRDITDNNINPIKGYIFQISGRIGKKKFIKSNSILKYDINNQLNQQYDSLNVSNLQYNIIAQGSYYKKLSKRSILKYGLNAQLLFNKAGILENEVVKIGGINTIRGFNDNFFTSDKYIINTLEYRFLLDRNSFLSAFIDHAYLNIITPQRKSNLNNYLGIGVGMQILTKAGTFGIYFASGRTETSSFDFSALKVHFGYVTRF